jgi:hypothetical protein
MEPKNTFRMANPSLVYWPSSYHHTPACDGLLGRTINKEPWQLKSDRTAARGELFGGQIAVDSRGKIASTDPSA